MAASAVAGRHRPVGCTATAARKRLRRRRRWRRRQPAAVEKDRRRRRRVCLRARDRLLHGGRRYRLADRRGTMRRHIFSRTSFFFFHNYYKITYDSLVKCGNESAGHSDADRRRPERRRYRRPGRNSDDDGSALTMFVVRPPAAVCSE